jgi:hypothetical protein
VTPVPSPTVLVPVQAPAPGLDACLASLDRSLPDGAPVLVADDACADPRVGAMAAGWCGRTRLSARYLRRERPLGLAANIEAAFADVPEGDLVLMRCDGEATPGWLPRLQKAAAADPRAASVAAWSGENELAAFADPAAPAAVAEAAASLDWPAPPQLPAAAGPAAAGSAGASGQSRLAAASAIAAGASFPGKAASSSSPDQAATVAARASAAAARCSCGSQPGVGSPSQRSSATSASPHSDSAACTLRASPRGSSCRR